MPTPASAGAPLAGAGGARLVAVAGPHAGQVIPITGPALTIGREAGRDLPLADTMTSRRHASIYAGPAGYVLRDEGSSNGTYVNGARVTEHLLHPGDEIRIGGNTFRFEL